jgi:UDP-glucose 4-epimerase
MEVIHAAQRVCGKTIRIEMGRRRPGDPAVLVGAADRARALLGWKPTRSALDTQIADAWNFMQKRPRVDNATASKTSANMFARILPPKTLPGN